MEVNSNNIDQTLNKSPIRSRNDELKKMVQEKFGDKVQIKKVKPPKIEDKVELGQKSGIANSSEKDFGDIDSNDPTSSVTHDKLKEILKTGAFNFSEKERATLSNILK